MLGSSRIPYIPIIKIKMHFQIPVSAIKVEMNDKKIGLMYVLFCEMHIFRFRDLPNLYIIIKYILYTYVISTYLKI